MKYDFTRRVDRSGGTTSSKWVYMRQKKPGVSPGIIPLSVADMELYNPPEIIQGLKDYLDNAVLGYTRVSNDFNRAVINWMKTRRHWDIESDWLVQSPGVVPALFMAVKAFTEPGDGIIIQPPVYYPFTGAIKTNGRRVVSNPLILKNNRYVMDYDDLEAKAGDPKNKVLLLCSPHNPVGRVWEKTELEQLAAICRRNGVLVVSDEIHFDLLLNNNKHTVFSTLSEAEANNCLVCTAPSKTFNIAGMQVSNIIIPNRKIREQFRAELASSAVNETNILSLKACEIAYTECGEWLDELIGLLEDNHALVKDFFAKHIPSVTVFPLEGTYLQWLDFRAAGLKNHQDLEAFMINDAEWFTDEGSIFGEEGKGFERINIACPTAVLQEALDRLLGAMKQRGLLQ
jgi:aminotransferase/cystathionine beta-lyase